MRQFHAHEWASADKQTLSGCIDKGDQTVIIQANDRQINVLQGFSHNGQTGFVTRNPVVLSLKGGTQWTVACDQLLVRSADLDVELLVFV